VPNHVPKLAVALVLTAALGCRHGSFPTYPASYHEFAYVTNGSADTVTVLDLVNMRPDRTLAVGHNPTGLATNPERNEVYAVNTGRSGENGSVTVINTELNRVEATIGVHRAPYFIEVAPDGKRAYVPNSASNTVSVLDLTTRKEIATVAAGEGPGVARVDPGNRTLIVTNRVAGSVSVYTVHPDDQRTPLTLRDSFDGCPGATDAVIDPDDPAHPESGGKAVIACSGGHQVMMLWLAATPMSWRGSQDAALTHDAKLALLDVGTTPTHLALRPNNGKEVFVTNFGSDSVSEISTWTNEVEGTYVLGTKPSRAVISQDSSSVWITNFGGDSASLYSIDDGRLAAGVRTGSRPDALAYSADEHILLIVDTGSSDIAVIRTQAAAPQLVTLLPAGPTPNDLVIKAFDTKTAK
jgi:YVTN family beta-propeller protein